MLIARIVVVHVVNLMNLSCQKVYHSMIKFCKRSDWLEKEEQKRKRERNVIVPRFERYIKTISGVCEALVTILTLLIMFCKVARRKKMRKLWSESRGNERNDFYRKVTDGKSLLK